MKHCTIIAAFFLLFLNNASADHLIVQRNGNLRKDPTTESEILEKIKFQDTLLLRETDQTNGYYHVISYLSGQEGWAYRTLVKKIAAEKVNLNELDSTIAPGTKFKIG